MLRVVVVAALAVAAIVFGASVAFFAQNQFRADHLVYGRHNDSFTPLWVACAVVALSVASRRTGARLVALSIAVTAGLSLALLALRLGVLAGTRGSYARRGVAFWCSPLADPAATARLWLSTLRRPRAWRGRAFALAAERA